MMTLVGISELLTLGPAAQKCGRRAQPEDLGIIPDAAMVLNGPRIDWVGPRAKLPRRARTYRQVDFHGRSVLPGFVECHTHSLFAGSRAQEFDLRNAGATYQEISRAGGGILSTVRATRAARDQELLKNAQKSVNAFARQGVTTLEIKSGYGLNEHEELRLLKLIRKLKGPQILSTYLGPHAASPEHADLDSYVNEIVTRTLPKIADQALADRIDIFVDQGFFTTRHAERYARAARGLGLPVVIHAHQLSRSGAVALAVRLKAHSAEHLIQLTVRDIKMLAQSDVACVLLPSADLYTGLAYPPARALIDAGAIVALATDYNPGTAPSWDLTLVGLLARVQMKMSLAEVITAYTVGGSHALRLLHEVGSLQPGKFANFSVLEGDWKDIFYSVGRPQVRETWIQGKKLKIP